MDLHPYLEPGSIPCARLWHVLATTGEHPVLRVGHACVHVSVGSESNGKLYVTGGANPSGAFTDIFILNLDTFSWTKYDIPGFYGRYEHTAFIDPTDTSKIYIFGGADGAGNRNDIQVFDTVHKTWDTVMVSGPVPCPRTYHNGACVGKQLIVYSGGEHGADPVTDRNTYAYDIVRREWSILKLRGDTPKPRHGHLMVAVGSHLFLHGGMSGGNFFDDLHVLDVDKKLWLNAKVKSVKPAARAGHGGCVSATNVYIFGGMNTNGALNDIFKLDTNTMEWSQIALNGPPPECRLDFASCSFRLCSRVLTSDYVQTEDNLMCVKTRAVMSSDNSPRTVDVIDITDQLGSLSAGDDVGGPAAVHTSNEDSQLETAASTDDVTACCTSDAAACCSVDDKPEADKVKMSTVEGVEVALIMGGMDTEGQLFDDCLVLCLD